jgi:hypothetical protein
MLFETGCKMAEDLQRFAAETAAFR